MDKINLPNANNVLVLGILSIVLGCAGIGIILGIIALILAKNDRQLYQAAPEKYLGFGNLNAGWIMSIIGICLSSLSLLYWLFWGWVFWNISHAIKSAAELHKP